MEAASYILQLEPEKNIHSSRICTYRKTSATTEAPIQRTNTTSASDGSTRIDSDPRNKQRPRRHLQFIGCSSQPDRRTPQSSVVWVGFSFAKPLTACNAINKVFTVYASLDLPPRMCPTKQNARTISVAEAHVGCNPSFTGNAGE